MSNDAGGPARCPPREGQAGFSGAKRRLSPHGVKQVASPSTPPAQVPINTRRRIYNSWPDTYHSSCTVGAFPPLFADPCFAVQNADSRHTVCVEMLPQVPHRHTNPSIHDDTCTTRGRIRTAARARWVPSPHFLGFCPAPRHWNSRPRSRCFPAQQN